MLSVKTEPEAVQQQQQQTPSTSSPAEESLTPTTVLHGFLNVSAKMESLLKHSAIHSASRLWNRVLSSSQAMAANKAVGWCRQDQLHTSILRLGFLLHWPRQWPAARDLCTLQSIDCPFYRACLHRIYDGTIYLPASGLLSLRSLFTSPGLIQFNKKRSHVAWCSTTFHKYVASWIVSHSWML